MKRNSVLLNGIAVVLVLAASIASFLFFQSRTEDRGDDAAETDLRCTEHLSGLGKALKQYAAAHGGILPDSLERLAEKGESFDVEMFRCPARQLHYIYLGDGLSTKRISPDTPIVFDRFSNHSGHLNVLYADFHVGRVGIPEREKYSSLFRLNSLTRPERERLEKRLLLLDKTVFQR